MVSLKTTVAATVQPVLVSDVRKHANIDTTADDPYIRTLVDAVVELFQNNIAMQFTAATFTFTLDGFPLGDLVLPIGPVTSITSISYTDAAGNSQTWSSALYQEDLDNRRVRPITTEGYPATDGSLKNVVVTFMAGEATAAAVPARIKLAIYLAVAFMYANRESHASTPFTFKELPLGVDAYLGGFRSPLP